MAYILKVTDHLTQETREHLQTHQGHVSLPHLDHQQVDKYISTGYPVLLLQASFILGLRENIGLSIF